MGRDSCEDLLEEVRSQKRNRTYRDLAKLLEACGFEPVRRKSSHVIWRKGSEMVTLVDSGKSEALHPKYASETVKAVDRAKALENAHEEED